MKINLVKEICSRCWMNQAELADYTGIKHQRIKDISTGRVDTFKLDEVNLLVEKLHLDVNWIRTGEGNVFIEGYELNQPSPYLFVSEVVDRLVKEANPDRFFISHDDALDVPAGTVVGWCEQGKIPYHYLKKFAEKYNKSIHYFLYGKEIEDLTLIKSEDRALLNYANSVPVNRLVAMEESPNLHHQIVKIQRYSVNAGAGRGVVNYDEQIVEYIELSREFIHDQLNLRHDKIAIISVKGASMEPTLNHGDQIFVDLTRKQINTNDVYVILVDEELLIKRVQMKVNGTVWLISDNKKFEPEQLTKDELTKLNVVGRVLPCKFGKFNL